MSVVVRPATLDDVPRLADIAVAAYSPYLPRLPEGVRPAPMDADYRSAAEKGRIWVAEQERAIAGLLVLIPADGYLLLENVAVHPAFQGQGIGRRLLGCAQGRAAELGLPAIRLYTNAVMVENQRLYEALGYVETGRRHDDGFDRVFYELRL
ncbi:MAG: GNAT family N-acetyltransferase [Protaetiibacter sp.]